MSSKKILSFLVLLAVSSVTLSACEAFENQLKTDRSGGLEKQDYRDALAPRDLDIDQQSNMNDDRSIPSLKPYISQSTSHSEPMPLVTISVNRSVPLRDIFYQLAQQSGFDIELDPRIRGSIIFSANQRPLDQVVERISEMTGLRYQIQDKRLRVELDTPYNKTYKIDYISYVRSNSSSITTDVSVVTGGGASTGSSFSTTSSGESDFWGDLEANLGQILANTRDNQLRTQNDPSVRIQEQNVNVRAVGVPDADGNIQVSPPDVIINVQELNEEQTSGGGSGGASSQPSAQFVINRQGGMVTVFASQAAHKEIEEYLADLKKAVTAQVLIEAKVMEVELNDSYSAGIDWRTVALLGSEFHMDFFTPGGGTFGTFETSQPPGVESPTAAFAVGYTGDDVGAVIRAISQFGTTKALSSPRLVVLNNQAAVLNVAKNRVYFEIEVERTEREDLPDLILINSSPQTVPEGVLINVMPSIDLERRTIAMSLRPTVTKVTAMIPDPGVQLMLASMPGAPSGIQSGVPEVNVQEIDTVLNVRSGSTAILGGMMQDITTSTEDGVPVLSDIPMIGNLFRTHSDNVRKTELVIFLKATILADPSESIHNTDRDLYRRFSDDRRPFRM